MTVVADVGVPWSPDWGAWTIAALPPTHGGGRDARLHYRALRAHSGADAHSEFARTSGRSEVEGVGVGTWIVTHILHSLVVAFVCLFLFTLAMLLTAATNFGTSFNYT